MQDHESTLQTADCKQRSFRIDEAIAMLPLVRSIVSDIQEVFGRVSYRKLDLHRLRRRGSRQVAAAYDDEIAESQADLQAEFERVWKFRDELEALGAVLRDPEEGRVEFPCEVNGNRGFLCWQPDDETILHWREADSSASTRHLLSDL
ncbi:MAG: DUF2203 family protein [Pirellulaceae bacterium]